MSAKATAWLMVVCTALGTGCAVTGSAVAGGCKPWVAALTGVGAGASAVLHTLMQNPNA